MNSRKRVISVDFDHTITVTEDEYNFGSEKPNQEVIDWVEEQYYDGNTIIVWTARPWSDAPTVVARLIEWDVRFHGMMMGKGGSDVYVDDKAVNVRLDGWRTAVPEVWDHLDAMRVSGAADDEHLAVADGGDYEESGINWETQAAMSKDVEENPELYDALAGGEEWEDRVGD